MYIVLANTEQALIQLQLRHLNFIMAVHSNIFFLSFSSPILIGRRLDVCHASTHDVALVRI